MRHLLLDFGGVCLVSPVELHRHVERVLGLPTHTLTWYGPLDAATDELWQRQLRNEISERDYWNQRARDVGRAAGHDAMTLCDYMAICFDAPEDDIIRPGARAIVADVRAAGGKVGILTNDLAVFHGPAWVASIQFFHAIDALVDASTIGILKPDPRAYAQALDALGAAAGDVVFVDDQARNVEGARAMGIPTVQFDVADPECSWTLTRRLLALID
jgi:putative hydrolase of the HAD superfamily